MSTTFDDLQKLREAAPARRWMDRIEPLLRLLNELGVKETLNVAVQCVETYLPKLKQSHQEVEWAEQYLGMIRDASSSGKLDDLRANLIPLNHSDKFSKSLAFVIAALRTAVLNIDDSEKAIETAADAISKTFMIEISERMNTVSREVSNPSTTDRATIQESMNKGVMLRIRLRNNPFVAELENSLWVGVADEIQRRLETKNKGAKSQ